jgi:hypothetical protein
VLVWLATLLAAVLLMRQRLPDRAFGWSLRLGLVVALVGMAVAFFMPMPTPEQKAAIAAGMPKTISGAHSVGVPDGGPGLPLVGWSTQGGDLRAPHFVGLHAMQVLPFVAWWLSRRRRLGEGHRTALIAAAGLAYLGLVVVLTWQALRGQSIISPDALTLSALGALLGIVLLVVGGVVARAAMNAAAARVIDPTEGAGVPIEDHGLQTQFCVWVRPATELRQIDRILSQWTADEITRMQGDEARGIARLREIRAALEHMVIEAELSQSLADPRAEPGPALSRPRPRRSPRGRRTPVFRNAR